jgi:hypothetical protein
LYLLHGEPAADEFLAAYQAAAGAAVPGLRLWDLWAAARPDAMVQTWVPNYRDLGALTGPQPSSAAATPPGPPAGWRLHRMRANRATGCGLAAPPDAG